MNSFFLLNESLNTASVQELEVGIFNLNDILLTKHDIEDQIFKHESLWLHNNGHGVPSDFYYSIVSKEVQRLVPFVFESLKSYPEYISSQILLDSHFPNDCRAFTGIDFSGTTIPTQIQITNSELYKAFRNNCIASNSFDSLQNFWNARSVLYPHLVFCDRVFDQISHLSISDDRFKLMIEKLKRLNAFASEWKSGVFDFKRLGMDNSPDTPTRIKSTLALRTFQCPVIGNRVFSYHIKWYFGSEPFRLYYHPEDSNHKVYIGYIGAKDEIGF